METSILELLGRIEKMEDRLTRVEDFLATRFPQDVSVARETLAPQQAVTLVPPSPAAAPEAESGSLASPGARAGQFLGVVGIACFVLAASFLIKLAIDSGWLTPERQVGLAMLFGLGLIVTGLYFRKSDNQYLSLLPAGGLVVLYFAAASGSILHSLYPPVMAVIMMSAISTLGVFLFTQFESEIYVGIAVVGSYLSSLMLPQDLDLASVTTYFLLWDVTFSVLAVKLRSRAMLLLATYLGLGVYHMRAMVTSLNSPQDFTFVASVLALQFTIFAGFTGGYSIRNRAPLTVKEAWLCFPVLIFFYGIEYSLLAHIAPNAAPWLGLGFAGLVYFVYFAAKQKLGGDNLKSSLLVYSFMALVVFHAGYLELCSFKLQIAMGPFALLAFPWVLHRGGRARAPFLWLLGLVAIISVMTSLAGTQDLSVDELSGICGLFTVILLGIYFGGRKKAEALGNAVVDLPSLFLFVLLLADAEFLVGTYRLVGHLGAQMRWDAGLSFFAISAVWGIFGVGFLIVAALKKDKTLARATLFVLGVTTIKVFLVDVASASGLVRVVCLLGLGSALYAGGFLVRKVNDWGK